MIFRHNDTSAMNMLSPFWLGDSPLVLASGSSARAAMLTAAGISIQVVKPDLDERAIARPLQEGGASPAMIAGALARAKAETVSHVHPGRWVLGADQVLDCAGAFFHKPADAEAASHQLAALSGRTHRLTSSAALVRDGKVAASATSSAELAMRKLSGHTIDHYLAHAGDAMLGSVGGYQLEQLGIQLFETIRGDHFTILGLPLLALLAEMRKLGVVVA